MKPNAANTLVFSQQTMVTPEGLYLCTTTWTPYTPVYGITWERNAGFVWDLVPPLHHICTN